MKEQFVPYEQALELKELGLNLKYCLGFYSPEYKGEHIYEPNFYTKVWFIQAPLWQQAFEWFREKYPNIEFSLPLKKQKDLGIFWGGFIQTENDNFGKSYGSNFKSYEEARLECLKKLIELCKHINSTKKS